MKIKRSRTSVPFDPSLKRVETKAGKEVLGVRYELSGLESEGPDPRWNVIGRVGLTVVLIGGGIPHHTQVASQYIAQQIEIDRPASAAAVSVALLVISFAVLFVLRRFAKQP